MYVKKSGGNILFLIVDVINENTSFWRDMLGKAALAFPSVARLILIYLFIEIKILSPYCV
jgi:hypothetical protein